MADQPSNMEEFAARFHEGERVSGYGLDVSMSMPCPWCAAPDFTTLYPIHGIFPEDDRPDIDKQMRTERTCSECGRSGKCLLKRDDGGVTFEFVQTGGDDPPAWLRPAPRRADAAT